jgi:guanine deaminase
MLSDGTSVHSVMIGGRFVVRDRRLLTVDLPRLAAQAAEARAVMDERSTDRRSRFECLALALADFCPALARTPWPINRWCGC